MPYFLYKGRNNDGDLTQGIAESMDSDTLAEYLNNNGITPIEISKTRAPKGSGEGFAGFGKQKVGKVDLILFTRQLYTLIKAGVPIMRGLAGLQQSTSNNALISVIKDMRQSLDNGRDLYASMARHPNVFSGFYVSMVHVGEMSGTLVEVLLRLHDFLMFEKETVNQIKSALRYPSFVMLAIAAALAVANLFIIPAFATIYAKFNAPLPPLTIFLINISKFSVLYWPYILGFILLVFFGTKAFLNSAGGRMLWDRYKLRIPIAGSIILKATLARFSRSFSISSHSGVPFVQALLAVSEVVDNVYLGKKIEGMREGVERGESIYRTAQRTGVFTPIVLQMIAIGEETGEIDDLMAEISQMYEREVQYEVNAMGAKIEPILLVVMGVFVLILALGIFLPMWDMAKVMLSKR